MPIGGGNLALAGQAKFNDGPWQLPEKFRGYSGFAKYSIGLGDGMLQVSLNTYYSTWQPTEQIPERAIPALIPNRYGTLDPFLHGKTEREIATVNYKLAQLEGHRLAAALQLEPAVELHLLPSTIR